MEENHSMNGYSINLLPNSKPKRLVINDTIASLDSEDTGDAFYVADLGDIITKHQTWKKLLPRVHPFYAVKCNDEHAVVKLLADLGTSFDCASKNEIEKILNLGVRPSRIIYAHPCKQISFLRYASKHNVRTMTFDNETELYKIKEIFPDARLVLRILPPTRFKVRFNLGVKFGCHPKKAKQLLTTAKRLDLNVVGISFHVGSGVEEAEAYASAVEHAHYVFQLGQDMGFNLELLDIGGGFPGQKHAAITFEEVAEILNTALDKYFPSDRGIQIIAEPGRYFVASAYTLVVNVIAKRINTPNFNTHVTDITTSDTTSFMYYVNDGRFGSFRRTPITLQPEVVRDCHGELNFISSIWGPTCSGLDFIMDDFLLPELHVGDWLVFEDMGSYTTSMSTNFNGMSRPHIYWYCNEERWYHLYPKRKK